MRFSTRNAFYLRASNYRVVPLFLYLDERHIDWMSELVLQQVIAELHGKVQDLLLVERHAKKHRVHVERGDGFQYCYFLRKTTRTEKKTFSLRPPSPPPEPEPEPQPKKRKRAQRTRTRTRSVSVTRARSASVAETEDGEDEGGDEDEDKLDNDNDEDPDFQIKPDPDAPSPTGNEEPETSIKDWKPDVSLSYQGFGTSSVQLVLIVEPYPPLPPSEYAPPSSRLSSRSASLALSRSRSRTMGTGRGTRYSSTSLALDNPAPRPQVAARNMRNATRSVSVATTSSTPAPGGRSSTPGGSGRSRTPLFIPRDTPFGEDEEDEDEHEEFAQALREGRYRLPSVMEREEDEVGEDEPEGMVAIGERLLHSSEIEEGVIRNSEGWEERGEGEESDVLGREEPGD